MRLMLLTALLFLSAPLFSAPGRQIQNIVDLTQETSLDPQAEHTWWASTTAQTPSEPEGQSVADTDNPPQGWKPAGVPNDRLFAAQRPKSVWLRKAFYVTNVPAAGLALRLGAITDADRTYLNGKLIGASGSWESNRPQNYDKVRIYRIPAGTLQPGLNLILIHCRSYFPGEAGIQKDRTAIGPADAMLHDHYLNNFREAGLLVVYATAASYFLFLFIRRRRERENLLFALFTYDVVIYQFLRTQIKHMLGWDFVLAKQIEYAAMYVTVPLVYYFLRFYFPLPQNRLMRIWSFVAGSITLAELAFSTGALFTDNMVLLSQINQKVAQPLWVPLIVFSFGVLTYKSSKGDRDAQYMTGGLAVMLATLGVDVLSNHKIIYTPPLSGYGFIFFVVGLALILANRFVRINEEVEDLNRNLEEKVTERTVSLNNTLQEVRDLKIQQDGDYFLTSLLLKPLNGLHAESATVSASMLLEQKKRFQFRQWASELGGDVASTYSVSLRGHAFTALINGDAMGKSMQGAGGALVLGTVFKNIVARSQAGEALSDHYPEQWLKECFVELQNVFVSFDGTMLASAVLGLVDETSGVLYYINAEHPYTVLLRKGQATFVERDEEILRKIGIQGLEGGLRVGTLQLLPGDRVIMGSDGRDDLAQARSADGKRVINEDMDVFRDDVAAAGGDLRELAQRIKLRGEITDDLSLLEISFTGPARPNADAARLVEEARAAGERQDHAQARTLLEQAHEADPANHTTLLLFVVTCRKAARTKREAEHAAVLAERLRLRQPENVENLILLSELYAMLGNQKRAAELAARAEYLHKAP